MDVNYYVGKKVEKKKEKKKFRMQEIRYGYFGTRINHIMIFQNLKK